MQRQTRDELPERFPGVANFRDCGGAASRFGGQVRRGLLYRSGQFSDIAPAAIAALRALDFALIADLRYPGERRHEPSPWPDCWAGRIVAHELEREGDAPHLLLLKSAGADVSVIDGFYRRFYGELPFDPGYAPLFGRVLRALSTCDGPALIHCSAGKDRTGILVALLHHILGVSRADAAADYLRSGRSTLAALAPGIIERVERRYGLRHSQETVLALLGVDQAYLDIAFRRIEETHGTPDNYFDAIGADAACRNALRARLIEQVSRPAVCDRG